MREFVANNDMFGRYCEIAPIFREVYTIIK